MSDIDLNRVAKHATDLAAHLRHVTDGDGGFAAGAWNALYEIRKVADDLSADLDERHRGHLTAQIATAAGTATTHKWVATTSALVCERCDCQALPSMLRHGQTPPCGEPCPSGWEGHPGHCLSAVFDDDAYTAAGASVCTGCKTVYTSTADVEAVAG